MNRPLHFVLAGGSIQKWTLRSSQSQFECFFVFVAAYTSYDISPIEAWELYAVRCRCASSFNLRAVALISFLLSTSCSFHIMADKYNTAAAARATKRNENNNNDIGDDQNREREAKSFDCECNEMQTFTSCDACPFTGKGFIYIVHFVRSMRGKPLGI